jgi:exopolysaccharide production protein ExoZ
VDWLKERFELSRNLAGVGHLRAMEGLRGLAVFLVFLVHYATLVSRQTTDSTAWTAVLHGMVRIGHSGVDLFFLISGYVIYGTLISKPWRFSTFFRRRVQRVYPAFLAVLAIYLVLSAMVPSVSRIPAPAWTAVSYVLANMLLLPGIFPIEPIITVAWSLSYEMCFYLAMPTFVVCLGMVRWPSETRERFFLALAVLLGAACVIWDGPGRLVFFLAGAILFDYSRRSPSRAPSAIATLLCLVAGWAVVLIPIAEPFDSAVWLAALFISFFVLCFSCFADLTSPISRVASWTPARWLGNMSYSYYLIHSLALGGMFRLIYSQISTPLSVSTVLALLPVAFFVTLVPATVLFLCIERPLSLKVRQRQPVLLPAGSEGA